MGKFIKEESFIRIFNANETPCVIHIGYDNFNEVKPITAFRIQTFYTWHFVLSGKGRLEIEDRSFSLKAGDIFFVPPNVRMRYFPDPENPWEYVWFSLNGEETAQHAEKVGCSTHSPVLRTKNFYRIRQILEKTFEILSQKNPSYFGILSAYYEILNVCTLDNQNTVPQNIKMFIDNSFSVPDFSIERLCDDVGISHSQMLRIFKKDYGKTLVQYLVDKRISFACELLKDTDISVEEVAFSCGFSDASHFMKTFKAKIGVSALKYRKTNRL